MTTEKDTLNQPVVFLVDDDSAVRAAISLLLKSAGLKCQAFDSAEAFLECFDPNQSGCLVTDIRMPGLNGLELQQRLESFSPRPPVILITGHGDVPAAVRALKHGAADFIEKPFRDYTLLDAVHKAIDLDRVRRPKQERMARLDKLVDQLSDREKEVMAMAAKGVANKVIADELSLSIKTVEFHRGNLMHKMGIESIAELVRISIYLENNDEA